MCTWVKSKCPVAEAQRPSAKALWQKWNHREARVAGIERAMEELWRERSKCKREQTDYAKHFRPFELLYSE